MKILGGILIMVGLMTIAGSGNDCDGKCMENANTFGEMLIVCFVGLSMIGVGGVFIAK